MFWWNQTHIRSSRAVVRTLKLLSLNRCIMRTTPLLAAIVECMPRTDARRVKTLLCRFKKKVAKSRNGCRVCMLRVSHFGLRSILRHALSTTSLSLHLARRRRRGWHHRQALSSSSIRKRVSYAVLSSPPSPLLYCNYYYYTYIPYPTRLDSVPSLRGLQTPTIRFFFVTVAFQSFKISFLFFSFFF